MFDFDVIDCKIFGYFQVDSWLIMQEFGDRVGLLVLFCYCWVKLLEECGVILCYVVIVDQKVFGLYVSVFILIKFVWQKEEDFNCFVCVILKWDEVLECYLMMGNCDYLLCVVVVDFVFYEIFLKIKFICFDGIVLIELSFVLSQVKYLIVLLV